MSSPLEAEYISPFKLEKRSLPNRLTLDHSKPFTLFVHERHNQAAQNCVSMVVNVGLLPVIACYLIQLLLPVSVVLRL